jgi:shikimate kinase
VTDADLADLLAEYRAGLEAELALLEQLTLVAVRQRGVTARRDYEQLGREGDERDRLTRALVAIEEGMKAVRARLGTARDRVATLAGYGDIVGLRQRAATLVARILATDEESLQALADAELARRAAVASLEQGETTLAAYRRVLTPTFGQASLVDRRG